MLKEIWLELYDEITDFFEDFYEHVFRKDPPKNLETKVTTINGVKMAVRPAYLFAERIDNLLKIVFGFSVTVSAITSTFFGFASLSDLLESLISTIPGRLVMIMIGVSYIILALWKIMHLTQKKA